MQIQPMSNERPHMPKQLLDGYASSNCLEDIFRTRQIGKDDNDDMWDPGQEKLGRFFLPSFQRPAVWTQEQKVRLVESLLMGVSIGSIVIVDSMNMEMQNNDLFAKTDRWILDGQQRLRSIADYLEDHLTVFADTDCEHKFSHLNDVEKRFLRGLTIGVIKIHTIDEQACREIYNRLNFGGTAHTEDQRA